MKLLNRNTVAEMLGVSKMQVHRYEKSGALPRLRISERVIRYREEDVEAFLEKKLQRQVFSVKTPPRA